MPELEQALRHHRAGRLQEAEALYRQILTTDPNHADALHMLGLLSAQTGKHEAAIRLIEHAIQNNPNIPDYHNNLGEIFRALGRVEAAIGAYQRALTHKPNYVAAHYNLGMAFQAQGNLTEAIAAYRQVVALEPNLAEAYNDLGVALEAQGSLDDAVSALERARTLKPDLAAIHYNLGNVRQAQGNLAAAITAYRDALKCSPDFAEAHNNLGDTLRKQGKLIEAAACCKQAIVLKPDYIDAYHNLASVLVEQGELQAAVDSYREILRRLPQSAEAWDGLGSILRQQQRFEEAIEAFHTAIRIRPDYPDAHNDLGLVLATLGDLEAARACYRKAIEFDPDYTPAYENLAKSHRYRSPDDDEIASLQSLAGKPNLSASAQMSLHFALGKMLDDCGSYDRAFGHYETANRLKRKTIDFHPEEFIDYVSEIINTFSKQLFRQHQDGGHPSALPVFIVGMPRSGTTLVEQIIASHPQAYGADELPHISAIATTLPARLQTIKDYPACTVEIDQKSLYALASDYLEKLRAIGGEVERASDKMPNNFLHLGLIALMFPSARIIHCRRDPLDVCLSIYFRRFGPGHNYAYDLGDIGVYYRQYQRLMQHWHEVLPLEICDVQYEDLVANQESESRRLIDYCGLRWDDRCLEYYENERPVQTMSNWQVRQPIYTDSIHRWKKYEKHLDELKRGLAAETSIDGSRQTPSLTLNIRGDIQVRVPNSVVRLTPYVLLEQEDWFEDEIGFVRELLKSGMHVIDIGASYGVYTLMMARVVGPSGKVWSFEPTRDPVAFLEESIKQNKFTNVVLRQIGLSNRAGTAKLRRNENSELNTLTVDANSDGDFELVELSTLDDCMRDPRGVAIDFVKMDAEGEENHIVEGGNQFFSEQSPLVLFELKHGDSINVSLLQKFRDINYATYRLVPGLNILVPFGVDEEPDPGQLNLFCCKLDRAEILEERRLLATTRSISTEAPHTKVPTWRDLLHGLPYAQNFLEGWEEGHRWLPDAEAYCQALDHYAQAHMEELPPAIRYSCLERSFIILSEIMKRDENICRLQSLARVSWEMGKRAMALRVLGGLITRLDKEKVTLTEPFLAVSRRFERIDPGGSVQQWCMASALEQQEKLCAFSSYFTGKNSLDKLAMMKNLPFYGPEMERRRQLVQLRYHMQHEPEPHPVLASPAKDNLNSTFWAGKRI